VVSVDVPRQPPCLLFFFLLLTSPLPQIYLNDHFPSGHTTFFLPSSRPAVLNAFPVKPSAGCALIFPHGDSKGSLLHEGSPVGAGGAKYVIRSTLLFLLSSSHSAFLHSRLTFSMQPKSCMKLLRRTAPPLSRTSGPALEVLKGRRTRTSSLENCRGRWSFEERKRSREGPLVVLSSLVYAF
jgi:hypothetical protein